MKEIKGNIWDFWEKGHWIVIPTNGSVKKNGEAVMGRGLALQAKEKIPELSKELGERLKEYGNFVFVFSKFRIITFPVKHFWFEKADSGFIEKSCLELKEIFRYNLSRIPLPLYLPRVGCGNGKLNWEDVKPILERHLDDRFIVVKLEELEGR